MNPHFEKLAGYENRRKHGCQNAESQGDGKAAYGTGAELIEHSSRKQCCEIGVENGALSLAEARSDGPGHGEPPAYFFSYARKDEHIGVHGHADGKYHACNAGQGKGRTEQPESGKEQTYGEYQHGVGKKSGQAVAYLHDDHDAERAYGSGHEACAYGVCTQRRTHRAFFLYGHLGGKGA